MSRNWEEYIHGYADGQTQDVRVEPHGKDYMDGLYDGYQDFLDNKVKEEGGEKDD